MVVSSYAALNKIETGNIRELKEHIAVMLEHSRAGGKGVMKPTGRHFVVRDKIFMGTNQKFVSCPIRFLIGDRGSKTELCQPVWTEDSLRTKVNRKAKVGVKKHSVIRLDDFSVVKHEKAASGYVFFIRSYQVIKKDVDKDACERWLFD
jgi:hypothetical protein